MGTEQPTSPEAIGTFDPRAGRRHCDTVSPAQGETETDKMSRPRTLPEENSELENLLRKHTQAQVADMFGVSEQAVSKAIRDRKLNIVHRVSFREYVPWTVATEHAEDYMRRMLRYYAMEQMGRDLDRKQAASLAKFKGIMDAPSAAAPHGCVVQYDPSHPQGPWLRVPRRPGIDTGYARNPDVP